MNRRHVDANVWSTMFERWRERADGYQELPIMWPRVGPWWPWHPAVMAALALVLFTVASIAGCP